MSDEAHSLRTIDWRSVFPFTQLFRAFRVAIHPAKMVLALVAILLVYAVGRTMDGLWLDRHLAVPGEVAIYEGSASRAAFSKTVDDIRDEQRREYLERAKVLRNESARTDPNRPVVPPDPSYRQLKNVIEEVRDHEVKAAHEAFDKAPEKTPEATEFRNSRVRSAYSNAGTSIAELKSLDGVGLCLTFVGYETEQIDGLAQAVISWHWFGPAGVFERLQHFIFTGPGWAISKHPVFFILFGIWGLLVWSVIGGAIARIAAVHVSQDEKISVRQALRFSTNKLMSFFAAPVMPLLLVGAIALVLAVLGLLTEIGYLGGLLTIVYGALFFVLIAVGVLVACALVGWICGFGLMYPTIAVEGSDAFDAVSRSISYVFARPWKVFIYSVISLIYGALTYLFLRFMALLTLVVLHESLTFWTRSTGPIGKTSIANAWNGPAGLFEIGSGPGDPYSLTFAENMGSGMLMFWVWLFTALLGAYVLSFFVSANTIMYYLLRHEVDATDIDDVYLEPSEDEFEDALPDSATGTLATRTESATSVPASAMTERAVESASTETPAMPTPLSIAPAGPMAVTPPAPVQPSVDATDLTQSPPTPPPAGS